ncbi:MAG TPA: hypothetical protein VFH71_07840 [Rhodanobacteraceae bacterium]|nr:hypothetical protein [Rhodanobacteraceae bacterium]
MSGIAFSEPDSSAHPRGESKTKTDHWLLADPPTPCGVKRGGRIDQPNGHLCGRHHLRRLKVLAKLRLRLADRAADPRIACGL